MHRTITRSGLLAIEHPLLWDAGDDIETVLNDPFYGEEGALDGNSVIPPPEGLEEGTETHLNEDLHLELAKALLGDFEYEKDDGNWGIEVYCEAVIKMENVLQRWSGRDLGFVICYEDKNPLA
ncbi:hypothetical protein ARMGADRAFT_1082016 [Armillaria gallica]|uniref:Uncharacterized protein n=1 Tax=Armillaria gallica TaxID=47427 RepID=A0A2H3DK57_ARMGA|nr:hypothetical protein ARMGADRAFT_1082016 [Armillaria gallica]